MIDRRELTVQEARIHRCANIVTRAMVLAQDVRLDVTHGVLESGDVFLLCSDGLTGPVSDAELAAIMAEQPLDKVADLLIERAFERGASDNVTLLLVAASQ